jgi:hypothetical protein
VEIVAGADLGVAELAEGEGAEGVLAPTADGAGAGESFEVVWGDELERLVVAAVAGAGERGLAAGAEVFAGEVAVEGFELSALEGLGVDGAEEAGSYSRIFTRLPHMRYF